MPQFIEPALLNPLGSDTITIPILQIRKGSQALSNLPRAQNSQVAKPGFKFIQA